MAAATSRRTRPQGQELAAQQGAESRPAVEKQRRWAVALLVLVIGAGLVTAATKRRAR